MSIAGETLGYRYPYRDTSFVPEYLLNRKLYCGPYCGPCWDSVPKSHSRSTLYNKDSGAEITTYGEALVKTFKTRKLLNDCHDGCVNSIEYNDDASLLVTGSDDLAVGLFRTSDWSLVKKIPTEHQANIFSAVIMPQTNDTKIISCGLDGAIILTDVVTGEGSVIHRERFAIGTKLLPVFSLSSGFGAPSVAVAGLENGEFLFVDTRMKNVVHTAVIDVPQSSRRCPINCMSLHPTQTNIVAVGSDNIFAYLCDLRFLSRSSEAECRPQSYFSQITCLKKKNSSKGIGGIAFSEAGDRLLINYKDEDLYCVEWLQFVSSYKKTGNETTPLPEHTIQIRRDRVSLETLAIFNGIHPLVERDVNDAAVASNPPTKTAGDTYLSRLFGSPTAASPHSVKYHGRANSVTMFKEATFLLGDEYVATGGDDGKIYFWEASTGKAVHTTKGDDDVVNGVLYHPSNPYTLVACGIDKCPKVIIGHIEDHRQNIKQSTMENDIPLFICPQLKYNNGQLAMIEEPQSGPAVVSEDVAGGLGLNLQMAMLSTGQSVLFRNILTLWDQERTLHNNMMHSIREIAEGHPTVSEARLTATDVASPRGAQDVVDALGTHSALPNEVQMEALLEPRSEVSREEDADSRWEDIDDDDEYAIYEGDDTNEFHDDEYEIAFEDSDLGDFFSPMDTDDDTDINDDSDAEYDIIEDIKKRENLSQTFAPMYYADWEPIQLLCCNAFILDFFLFRVLREPAESTDISTKLQGNCIKLLSKIISVLQWFPQGTLVQSSYEHLARFLSDLYTEYLETLSLPVLEEVPSSSCLPEQIRILYDRMETLSPNTLGKCSYDVGHESSDFSRKARQKKGQNKKGIYRSRKTPELPIRRKKSDGVQEQCRGNHLKTCKNRKRVSATMLEEDEGHNASQTIIVPTYILSISRVYGIQHKFEEDHHVLIDIVGRMYDRMRKPNNKLWESMFDEIVTDGTVIEEKSSEVGDSTLGMCVRRNHIKPGNVKVKNKFKDKCERFNSDAIRSTASSGNVANSQFVEGVADPLCSQYIAVEYIDMLAADAKGSTDLDHIFEHQLPSRPSEVMEQFVRNGELILEEVYRLLAIIKHRDNVSIAITWDLVKWRALRPIHTDGSYSTQDQYSLPYMYELTKIQLLLKLFELYIFPNVRFPVCDEDRTRRLLLACTQYAMLRSCIAFMNGQANIMLAEGVIPLLKLAQTMFLPSCITTSSVKINDITIIPCGASKLCMSAFALLAMANCPPTDSGDRNISGMAKEVEQYVALLKKRIVSLDRDVQFQESSEHAKDCIERLLVRIREKLIPCIEEGNIPKINL